ncbi:MAG TPA: hypothetical protein VF952_10175 [Chloroflexia bacterium]|jgi:hypothetical protein
MKFSRFAFITVVLFVSIAVVGLSLTSLAALASAPQTEDMSTHGVVTPLTPEQQAAIDAGLSYQPSAWVRPENYDRGTKHCVSHIEPIQPGQQGSIVQDRGCYDNFADALAVATGGRVRLPKDFRADDITQEILDTGLGGASGNKASIAGAQLTTVVIGIDWEHANFSGNSHTAETTHTAGCTDGTSYGWENMGGNWWNDRISSAKGYSGCNADHYEHSYYGGATLRCPQGTNNCANMGIMNDQTSSINWRR